MERLRNILLTSLIFSVTEPAFIECASSKMSVSDKDVEVLVTVADIDIEFLPVIHEIVKTIERDPQDPGLKNKESLEASQKIQELGKRIESVRDQVKKLPGVDFTKDEQAAQLKALKKQLVLKQELIQKYKNLGGDLSSFLNTPNTNSTNGHD